MEHDLGQVSGQTHICGSVKLVVYHQYFIFWMFGIVCSFHKSDWLITAERPASSTSAMIRIYKTYIRNKLKEGMGQQGQRLLTVTEKVWIAW